MNVSNLIAGYGYWAVFLLVAVESLGIPRPAETALITAGIWRVRLPGASGTSGAAGSRG